MLILAGYRDRHERDRIIKANGWNTFDVVGGTVTKGKYVHPDTVSAICREFVLALPGLRAVLIGRNSVANIANQLNPFCSECGREFERHNEMLRHRLLHFTCTRCGDNFNGPDDLMHHRANCRC